MLSCVNMKANQLFGAHTYFSVKVSFKETDHYLDINVSAGSCTHIKDGEYPDFYVAAPAYNVGEKRMYARGVKEHLMKLHPKKVVTVFLSSVRVNGRKGLTPTLAVYGIGNFPESVPLGKVSFKTFGKLEELVKEIRVSKPPRILSYSLDIGKRENYDVAVYEATQHIPASDGGDNLIGQFRDGRKDAPGRHTFLVSQPITENLAFPFKLNTRAPSGNLKKTLKSRSPTRGSQI